MSHIYTYIYTVLGFIVPFEYFYCKKKKGSGFEIVENKCIFVHQSYLCLLFQSCSHISFWQSLLCLCWIFLAIVML